MSLACTKTTEPILIVLYEVIYLQVYETSFWYQIYSNTEKPLFAINYLLFTDIKDTISYQN